VIQIIKSESKLIIITIMLNYLYFKYIQFFLTFYESVFTQKLIGTILFSTTLFNVDNNKKCFLSRKSAFYNDF